jgi:hypothetical protein
LIRASVSGEAAARIAGTKPTGCGSHALAWRHCLHFCSALLLHPATIIVSHGHGTAGGGGYVLAGRLSAMLHIRLKASTARRSLAIESGGRASCATVVPSAVARSIIAPGDIVGCCPVAGVAPPEGGGEAVA